MHLSSFSTKKKNVWDRKELGLVVFWWQTLSMIGNAHGLMVLWWQTWEFIKLSWSTGRPPLRRHSSELKLVYYQSSEYACCENRCIEPKIENKKKNVRVVKVIRMKHNMKQQKGIFVESLWLLMNKVTLLRKPFIMNHFSWRVVHTNIGRDVLKILMNFSFTTIKTDVSPKGSATRTFQEIPLCACFQLVIWIGFRIWPSQKNDIRHIMFRSQIGYHLLTYFINYVLFLFSSSFLQIIQKNNSPKRRRFSRALLFSKMTSVDWSQIKYVSGELVRLNKFQDDKSHIIRGGFC